MGVKQLNNGVDDTFKSRKFFDRYQSIRQYHRTIDSLLRVWCNGDDGARPDTANAVSTLGRNFCLTEGVVER